jgi:Concanavalin A-like lectin/glucanases superfamily
MPRARMNGGVTGYFNLPTSNSAGGIWSATEENLYRSSNNFPSDSISDPQFNSTILLLHGDGGNGSNNSVFLDSSTNALTVTRNGTPTQGTFTPYSQTGWSNYFNGSTSINFSSTSALILNGVGTWTMEMWLWNENGQGGNVLDKGSQGGSSVMNYRLSVGGGSSIGFQWGAGDGSNYTTYNTTNILPASQWTHVAIVANSFALSIFINGVKDAVSATLNSGWGDNGKPLFIGSRYGTDQFNTGYVSNLRIIKGTALYTSNFTPPTTALTSITNTTFLTCQSNRFVDNGPSSLSPSFTGTPIALPFSPLTAPYSYGSSTVGGSMYFNGSTDYLSMPSTNLAFGTGDFTVECWLYPTGSTTSNLIDFRPSGTNGAYLNISLSTLAPIVYVNSTAQITGSAISLYAWTHLAVVRSSGTTKLYINGIQSGSSWSDSTNYLTGTTVVLGAGSITVGGSPYAGYISNARVVKGTAVYTTTFTPPTAPLTATANTQLLVSGTNAGIYDQTAKNDLISYASAQISTTQSKFGSSSMYFNGSTDYLTIPNNIMYYFAAGDFTVEAWIYPTSVSGYQYIASVWGVYGQSDTTYSSWQFRLNNNNLETVLQSSSTSTTITGSGTNIQTNTWQHVALVRTSNVVKLFVSGNQVASQSYSSTLNNTSSAFAIGVQLGGYYYYNGYIDDLRVSRYARYTSTFTPPTSAFLNR